jgi:hypothetical protein
MLQRIGPGFCSPETKTSTIPFIGAKIKTSRSSIAQKFNQLKAGMSRQLRIPVCLAGILTS